MTKSMTASSRPIFRRLFASVFIIICAAALAAAPELTGTWKLDPERSESVPPGAQEMKVKQSGDRIEVELKISGPQGERTVSDVYLLDGKEVEFTPVIMMGKGEAKKGKRTTRKTADGNGFDATEESTVEDAAGTDKIKGKRSWRLSADGKLLTVEIEMEGGQGNMKSKRVFVRQ